MYWSKVLGRQVRAWRGELELVGGLGGGGEGLCSTHPDLTVVYLLQVTDKLINCWKQHNVSVSVIKLSSAYLIAIINPNKDTNRVTHMVSPFEVDRVVCELPIAVQHQSTSTCLQFNQLTSISR